MKTYIYADKFFFEVSCSWGRLSGRSLTANLAISSMKYREDAEVTDYSGQWIAQDS